MTGAVLLRRTSIRGPDTLVAIIAIFVFVINKETFFNASFIAVLMVTVIGAIWEWIGVKAIIVSRDAGLVTRIPLRDAFAVAFSVVVAVYTTFRVIITAEAGVSALCCSLGAGPVACLRLFKALSRAFAVPVVSVKLVLRVARLIAQSISLNTLSIAGVVL